MVSDSVASVVKTVLKTVSSPIQKELGLVLGYGQELEKISSTLTAIDAKLKDAEEEQFSNNTTKNWLQKLKDAAYELDDILEECAYHDVESEHEGVNCALPDCGLFDMVRSSSLYSFHPKHACFRWKTARRMKTITERLDQISKERAQFHSPETARERSTGVMDWRETFATISAPQVYGRAEDMDKIVDFLVGKASHSEDLSVYPIVGQGGLGKTTLAQLIFNDERVKKHFEPRIWVCVSEDFSLKRMTKDIIEAMSEQVSRDMALEVLHKKAKDLLQTKRYLLVLDDVWDDGQDNWEKLKSVLAGGAKGASVLVTTRLTKVATIMGTMLAHELSKLSDGDCWGVFEQRAFGLKEKEWAELVKIGKEIVKKCGGVPLAAKTLGSLLRFERREEKWLFVRDSKLWNLPQDEKSIMPALRLSYLNLPVELRQCFAFCALFPKDERIEKQFLVGLWITNEVISSNQVSDAEVNGDDVVNELYCRSFFEDVHIDGFDQITSFKLHDLVHDLAESVAKEVCCITDDEGVTPLSKRIRHLSTCSEKSFVEVKYLKTYIRQDYIAVLPPHVLKCYSLRVLKIRGLQELPAVLGCLKYLSYLDISSGGFKILPESLCELLNLEFLILDDCSYLEELPNNLICLKALEHLSLKYCTRLSSLPPQIGKLTSLRTLSMYFVSNERGFLLAELGQLNLKGKLHIKHLERVKSVMDAQEANMSNKHLDELQLSWDRNEESQLQENVEQILEVLQPHTQQLQTLGVEGYKGAHFPQWMSSPSLKYLNDLMLEDCNNCLQLPQLGKLPSLKRLSISNMIHIKYLCEESYGGGVVFMALDFLLLTNLPKLIRLSREDGEIMFPHLSILEIIECPKLLGLPNLPSINDLRITEKCKQDLLSSTYKLSSLESVELFGNKELTCFPNGMLRNHTSLKKLTFSGLSKLEVLPTEIFNLKAIQELYIACCDSLTSLGDEVLLQGLHSLRILKIVWCRKFNVSAGFQYLTCLEQLTIGGCPEVKGLDEALQYMTSLQSLDLWYLPDLETLPDCFGNLDLLHELTISQCPKLMCLPTSFQFLRSLQILNIYECPELEKRCQKETGEDWPKIAHVPSIQIG